MYVCIYVCIYVCMCKPQHVAPARPKISIFFRRFVPIMSAITPVPVTTRSKAWVCCRSLLAIMGSNPAGAWKSVCCECCVLLGKGFCNGPITRPEESYRVRCTVVCDIETSWMRRPWHALGRSAKTSLTNIALDQTQQFIYTASSVQRQVYSVKCTASSVQRQVYSVKCTVSSVQHLRIMNFRFRFVSICHPVVMVVLILDPESCWIACFWVHTCLYCVHTCLYCVCSKEAMPNEVWKVLLNAS
jgi:hypothetical protein